MKGAVYIFDPVIYPVRLYVAHGINVDDANEAFPGADITADDKIKYDGLTINDGRGGILIWYNGKMSYSLITHEAVHAAQRMLDYLGVESGMATTEPLAYMVEWVFKCCEEVKKNKVTTGKIYKNVKSKKAKRKGNGA